MSNTDTGYRRTVWVWSIGNLATVISYVALCTLGHLNTPGGRFCTNLLVAYISMAASSSIQCWMRDNGLEAWQGVLALFFCCLHYSSVLGFAGTNETVREKSKTHLSETRLSACSATSTAARPHRPLALFQPESWRRLRQRSPTLPGAPSPGLPAPLAPQFYCFARGARPAIVPATLSGQATDHADPEAF